jgi:hypothetical protein
VKIRPLPDLDLARIAPQPDDQKRKSLQQFRQGQPPFSYGPLRESYHDIFNVQPALFGPVAATDWLKVEAVLRRKCKMQAELIANLQVAEALHGFALENGILGRAQEFYPMALGAGGKVAYWLQMVLAIEGRPLVPYIDPRRSLKLPPLGRRFAFSMMHQRIRAADPDFAEARLGILQFGDVEGGVRHPKLYTDQGVDLYSLDELESMIAVTYEIWREVCEEREMDARRKSGGQRGSLL